MTENVRYQSLKCFTVSFCFFVLFCLFVCSKLQYFLLFVAGVIGSWFCLCSSSSVRNKNNIFPSLCQNERCRWNSSERINWFSSIQLCFKPWFKILVWKEERSFDFIKNSRNSVTTSKTPLTETACSPVPFLDSADLLCSWKYYPDWINIILSRYRERLFPTGVSSQASLTMQQVGFIFSSNVTP